MQSDNFSVQENNHTAYLNAANHQSNCALWMIASICRMIRTPSTITWNKIKYELYQSNMSQQCKKKKNLERVRKF